MCVRMSVLQKGVMCLVFASVAFVYEHRCEYCVCFDEF